MTKKILITGGAGFIGSWFVRTSLAKTDWQIVNLDKLTYAGHRESLGVTLDDPRHTFVQGDIGDTRLVNQLLREHDCHAVVHMAAESHVDRSIDAPDAFVETNVTGTLSLLKAALAHFESLTTERRADFRFLQVSTDEVFGSLGSTGHFNEQSQYRPNSPYAASKAASDHLVRAYYQTYGLPTLTTNCSNNYGPYQYPEKLIPRMILNAVAGKRLPVYGRGDNIRDWLFVEDHCDALRIVLDKGVPGETYGIGGNCERTNIEIVKLICEIVDRSIPNSSRAPCSKLIDFVTDRPGHDFRYAIDSSKIRHELDWQPKADFAITLEHTVRWYLENRDWITAIFGKRDCRDGD